MYSVVVASRGMLTMLAANDDLPCFNMLARIEDSSTENQTG